MNTPKLLLAALATALALPAAAQATQAPAAPPAPLPPDTPLIVEGDVRVEAADFEGSMLRVPENRRAGFRLSYDRVVSVVDSVYVARAMGQKARDAGLDKDPAVQARLRQLQDQFLADLYVKQLEKDAGEVDLETRAREIYIADKDKFMTEEEVHVQQILVGMSCRTRDAAREVAQKAYQEAKAGRVDFLELATKYNDVGEKAHKGGDIGTGPVKKLAEPVRLALAQMKPGEISQPVESQFGMHVLKLIARNPATVKPFDTVKADIIAAERQRVQRKRIEDTILALRSSSTVVTYRDNVQKLVAPGVDLDELSEKARAASRAQAEALRGTAVKPAEPRKP